MCTRLFPVAGYSSRFLRLMASRSLHPLRADGRVPGARAISPVPDFEQPESSKKIRLESSRLCSMTCAGTIILVKRAQFRLFKGRSEWRDSVARASPSHGTTALSSSIPDIGGAEIFASNRTCGEIERGETYQLAVILHFIKKVGRFICDNKARRQWQNQDTTG
ncbi:hypothetical protein RRG08_018897 [Elysia crispata]|uniref:Uncharacterized protein n=1 Tax=Elysia crispata TaxID=231223 RepID=A0AAE1A869_9GAST|nr:hypothetical protein RRG08_018897 [Elysia crispata]